MGAAILLPCILKENAYHDGAVKSDYMKIVARRVT
jgi:hypothetical protein